MAGSDNRQSIDANITGPVSGQVAVGDYILQIGSISGSVVQVQAPGQIPTPKPIASPIDLRPRQFANFLDREQETQIAITALHSQQSVQLCGTAGIGKSVFLRWLAHAPESNAFPDGVIYISARHQPGRDALQILFEAFYECDMQYRPTDAQIQRALRDKRALVLLDSLDPDKESLESLINAVPSSTFVIALRERALWGEGCCLTLHGLPMDAALQVMEQELGRKISPDERDAAQSLCESVGCNPLKIIQAAAVAREENRPIADLACEAQASSETLAAQMIESLPGEQREVILALAALGRAATHPQHIAAIAQSADVSADLDSLERRRLVKSHAGKYALTSELADTLAQRPELDQSKDRAMSHYTQWAETESHHPESIAQEADAITTVSQQAARTGRWNMAMRLAYAVEGALSLANMWRAWGAVMEHGLQAAQAVNDTAFEGWALHQIGTQALVMGDAETAKDMLTRALDIRVSLHDEPGIQATLNNLGLLGPYELPSNTTQPRRFRLARPKPAHFAAMGLALAVLLTLLLTSRPKQPSVTPYTEKPSSNPTHPAKPQPGNGAAHPEDPKSNEPQTNGTQPSDSQLGGEVETPPATLKDLQIKQDRVNSGETAIGTVTLTGPAPANGAKIRLSASNTTIDLADSVVIPKGDNQAPFEIKTQAAPNEVSVKITASYRHTTASDTLMIKPPVPPPPPPPPPLTVKSVRVIQRLTITLGRGSATTDQTIYDGPPKGEVTIPADKPSVAIELTFNAAVAPRRASGEALTVVGQRTVNGYVTLPQPSTMRWDAKAPLAPGLYTLTLQGGPGGITSTRKQTMERSFAFQMRIGAPRMLSPGRVAPRPRQPFRFPR